MNNYSSAIQMQIKTEKFIYKVKAGDRIILKSSEEIWSVPKNKKVMIVGKNGSGKTSFLECIGGYKKLTSPSKITVDERDRNIRDIAMMRQIPSDCDGSVESFIKQDFMFQGKSVNNVIWDYLTEFNFYREEYYRNLSFGQKRVLSFLCAYAHNAKVLLLDEYGMGIHYDVAEKMKDMINDYKYYVLAASNDPNFHKVIFDYESIIKDGVIYSPVLLVDNK